MQPVPSVSAGQSQPTAVPAADASRTSATNPPVCCLSNSQSVSDDRYSLLICFLKIVVLYILYIR